MDGSRHLLRQDWLRNLLLNTGGQCRKSDIFVSRVSRWHSICSCHTLSRSSTVWPEPSSDSTRSILVARPTDTCFLSSDFGIHPKPRFSKELTGEQETLIRVILQYCSQRLSSSATGPSNLTWARPDPLPPLLLPPLGSDFFSYWAAVVGKKLLLTQISVNQPEWRQHRFRNIPLFNRAHPCNPHSQLGTLGSEHQ